MTDAHLSMGDSMVETRRAGPLRVVGLGASAGGLEALKEFFRGMIVDSGLAFVVVQHLDPEYQSMLQVLLADVTQMEVIEAANGMPPEPNRIHVIPSDSDLFIAQSVFELRPRELTGRLHLPIDAFFRSLAENCGEGAVGIVLSGSGADGTEGLRAIRAEGGLALVQEPDSAQYRSMPECAIAANAVDFRGAPAALADALAQLARNGSREPSQTGSDAANAVIEDILRTLRQQTGVDFSAYKRTTARRRIERRMTQYHARTFEQYLGIVQEDPGEAKSLLQDMLIHVTSFFRDPEAFAVLRDQALEALVNRKRQDENIRVWVPGCATGEEAYSLAICVTEALDGNAKRVPVKIFGTDLSEDAVEKARRGRYLAEALVGVSDERIARFFEPDERGFRIGQQIRDMCVFVKHDLTRDSPFAKLDLISCRNLLIYFDSVLQRRLVPMLHYCLNPQGYLFLGQSESTAGFSDLFAPVDKSRRIFVKTGDTPRYAYPIPGPDIVPSRSIAGARDTSRAGRDVLRQVDHLLLARYGPPAVVINRNLEVLEFRGRTGDFLEAPPGQPQKNLLRMARDGLVGQLHDAIERAKAQLSTIRTQGLRVWTPSGVRVIDLEVVPLASASDPQPQQFLVLFEQTPRGTPAPPPATGAASETFETPTDEVERLRAELATTKEYLRSLLTEHQAVADDLGAANESLSAANEELQSTNEELQSAQEELQSTNEEMSTVNDQLRIRNHELDEVASDLTNVLASVEIPMFIVDLELRVRRFTPTAKDIANFIAEDVGRSIEDIKLKVKVDSIGARIAEVIEGLRAKEWEVEGSDGRWFRMQIRPYHGHGNRLDGAVLAFVDVTALKRSRVEAEGARDYARSIVEAVATALVVLDATRRIISANAAFLRCFGLPEQAVIGHSILGIDQKLSGILQRCLPAANGEAFSAFEVSLDTNDGPRVFSLSGRPILHLDAEALLLLAIEDVTSLRALEAERAALLASEKQSRMEAERANRAKDLFLATLSHELRTPLSTMLISAQLLRKVTPAGSKIERSSAAIERAVQAQARLIEDLLGVSRIVSGKLALDLSTVDLKAVVQSAVDVAAPAARAKSLKLELLSDEVIGTAFGDHLRLQQVVSNLLNNAIKFTSPGGRVTVELTRSAGKAVITVEDTGMGISAEILPQLFDRFVQANSAVTRPHGGLGLGLSIVRHLVEVHGGTVRAESDGPGKGATFRVTLPLGNSESVRSSSADGTNLRSIAGVRILFVEDDDDTRASCTAMLDELGAEVRSCASAADGLAAIAQFRPHVILSDIAMPGEDGLSFMRAVRQLPPEQGGNTPAAALSALACDEDRQHAVESGYNLHLAKPIDTVRLVSGIGSLLGAEWSAG